MIRRCWRCVERRCKWRWVYVARNVDSTEGSYWIIIRIIARLALRLRYWH